MRLHGTYQPSRGEKPRTPRHYSEPVMPPGQPTRQQPVRPWSHKKPNAVHTESVLTEDQTELRQQMPAGLGARGRCVYLAACEARWLGPIHARLLAAYAAASDRLGVTSGMLDRMMRDPTFATPGSEAHEAGRLYSRMVARLETRVLDMAQKFGLSPKARAAFRLEPPERRV